MAGFLASNMTLETCSLVNWLVGIGLVCAGMFYCWCCSHFGFRLGILELTWKVSVMTNLIYVSLSYAEIKNFAKKVDHQILVQGGTTQK